MCVALSLIKSLTMYGLVISLPAVLIQNETRLYVRLRVIRMLELMPATSE